MSNAPQLPPEQQETQSASERMFRDQMLRAGAKYQTPEGYVITPKERPATGTVTPLRAVEMDEPDSQDERYIIDLEIDDVDQREITLRGKNGVEHTLVLPAPKMETAFMVARYESLIAQAYQKLAKTSQDQEAERQNKTINQLYLKMVRLMIPEMDANFLSTLNMRVVREVVSIGQEMIQLSMSMSNQTPLSYIKRIYRMLDKPYGDSDRGVMIWLKEHFQEFEEAFGNTDLPNE